MLKENFLSPSNYNYSVITLQVFVEYNTVSLDFFYFQNYRCCGNYSDIVTKVNQPNDVCLKPLGDHIREEFYGQIGLVDTTFETVGDLIRENKPYTQAQLKE